MAEPLLPDQQLSAMWHAPTEHFRVVGWRFGPAGSAVVDVTTRLRLALDVARPTQLGELLVHAPAGRLDDGDATVLRALLGGDTTDRLARLVGDTDRLHALRAAPPSRVAAGPLPDEQAVLIRFALAGDLALDATLLPEVATLAGFEAASLAANLDALGERFARDLALDHATWLGNNDYKRLVSVAARGDGAVDMLRAVRDLVGRDTPWSDRLDHTVHDTISRTMARRGMQQLAEEGVADAIAYLEAERPPAAPVAAAMAAPAGAPRRARAERVEEPVAVDAPEHVLGWLAEGGAHLHVVARASDAGDAWVRAFDRDRRLLLGLSPLEARGGESTALVLLPPGTRADQLVVDVTTEPGAPRPSSARVQFIAAIALGRRAARRERLGVDSAEEWAACAEAWRRAGDGQRAQLATDYASGGRAARSAGSLPLPAPLITDEVIESLS